MLRDRAALGHPSSRVASGRRGRPPRAVRRPGRASVGPVRGVVGAFRPTLRRMRRVPHATIAGALACAPAAALAAGDASAPLFPPPLQSYLGEEGLGLWDTLVHRVAVEPLNLVATALFALAILHTFLAPALLRASHRLAHRLNRRAGVEVHSVRVELLHFLGEVEAVFGIWVVPFLLVLVAARGARAPEQFLSHVNFTEALFVVVVMAIAATRPVLVVAERLLGLAASLGRGTPLAWWAATLSLGPLLGSFITEPAAMIICALVLDRRLFTLAPSERFRYATLGLLFVNVSIGGTLTHFAAPPVLMVARPWAWDTAYMATHFGWRAVVAILVSNVLYLAIFWREFARLAAQLTQDNRPGAARRGAARALPGNSASVILDSRVGFFGERARVRIHPIGHAQFLLRLLQRLAGFPTVFGRLVHVGQCLGRTGERAELLCAVRREPVITVGALHQRIAVGRREIAKLGRIHTGILCDGKSGLRRSHDRVS